MQKIFLAFLSIISISLANISAQVAPNKYIVSFSDKNNSVYNVNQAIDFLSQKAIDRRLKYNIAITDEDFPVNQNYLQALENIGVNIINTSRWNNAALIFVSDTTLLPQIQQLPFVINVKKQQIIAKNNSSNRDKWQIFDEINQNQKPLNFSKTTLDYGLAFQQIIMHEGDFLHELGHRGAGITIAVFDAGFFRLDSINAFNVPFALNQIIGTYDFVEMEESVYEDHPHGTLVLSTMAAFAPTRMIGTAPEANYLLLRTEDASSEYRVEEFNWLVAAEYADSIGVDIINSSLGYTDFDDTTQNYQYSDMDGNTTLITKAANLAASKGILVVNSAGNLGGSIWRHIAAPSDAENVLTVGAINQMLEPATFSSEGPTADGRIKPDVVATGQSTTVVGSSGNIISSSGTSFSSPIIAGLSACLLGAYPQLSPAQMIQIIRKSAHQFNQPDNKMGYGIPNFRIAMTLVSDETKSISDKNLTIYPNPFLHEINLELEESSSKISNVKVYDVLGKEVLSNNYIYSQKNIKIDSNDWSNGMYLLTVFFENGQSISKKIIKK
jgi:subtilisin family serine protease